MEEANEKHLRIDETGQVTLSLKNGKPGLYFEFDSPDDVIRHGISILQYGLLSQIKNGEYPAIQDTGTMIAQFLIDISEEIDQDITFYQGVNELLKERNNKSPSSSSFPSSSEEETD